MAQINRRRNKNQYPYKGTFYIKGEPTTGDDGDLFGDGATEGQDEIILETVCDITETNRAFASGAITASYDVFYPLKDGEEIVIERGQMFKGEIKGLVVNGMVISIGHSQLGGVHAYIKCSDI